MENIWREWETAKVIWMGIQYLKLWRELQHLSGEFQHMIAPLIDYPRSSCLIFRSLENWLKTIKFSSEFRTNQTDNTTVKIWFIISTDDAIFTKLHWTYLDFPTPLSPIINILSVAKTSWSSIFQKNRINRVLQRHSRINCVWMCVPCCTSPRETNFRWRHRIMCLGVPLPVLSKEELRISSTRWSSCYWKSSLFSNKNPIHVSCAEFRERNYSNDVQNGLIYYFSTKVWNLVYPFLESEWNILARHLLFHRN